MKYNKKDLINYRIARATETLEEAKWLAEKNYWNTVANRLYYACFYVISAYLIQENVQTLTHNGVKIAFHKLLIKTNILPKSLSILYGNLFNKRQEADYQDFQLFDKQTIEPLIDESINFVKQVEQLITL